MTRAHGLVAGTAGSGKSGLLESIVASLIAKNAVSSLRLAIVDPKILTFTGINACPFLMQPVITDVKAAITLLTKVVTEMEKVTSSTNSQIVLDEPGADQLLGRSDLLCNSGRGLMRAQSYFIPQPEFLNLCLARNR